MPKPPRRSRSWLGLAVALALALGATVGLAQTGPGPSPLLAPPTLPSVLPGGAPLPSLPPGVQQDVLQRLLDAGATRGPPSGLPGSAPRAPVQAAPLPAFAASAAPEEPLSAAEAFFAARLDPPVLRQFGYETFRAGPAPPPGFGALPEDYVLGPDDEVILAFRGRARQTLTLRIGRDGMLMLPDIAPVPAAGRSLKDLRAHLEGLAARDLAGSEVFLSIGQVRQMNIFVAGEVMRPGFQPLNALSTALDALSAAGGVRKTGSLRAIRIEGPRGRRVVDLYSVIADAPGDADLSLREGDRIIVPPVGGTVAVAGDVARPAIYELPAGQSGAPLAAMLALAGGTIRQGGNRLMVQQNDGAGRRSYAELSPAQTVRRGDAVLVQPGADVVANQVRLAGHVSIPVTRAAAGGRQSQTLRGLISDRRLLRNDPYVRLGVVWRADRQTGSRGFIPFDLGRVLEGRANMALHEGDEVIVFGRADIAWLASPAVQRALRGEAPAAAIPQPGAPPPPDCAALTTLALASRASPQRFAHVKGAGFPEIGPTTCPQVMADYPDLASYLLDQTVVLTGEVRAPGPMPIVDDTGLDLLIASAGGLSDAADLRVVEFAREPPDQGGAIPLARTRLDLTSRNFAAVRLSPRDTVRIPRAFGDRDTGPVILVGEFLRPGTYDIRRGERLSEVIARAGGLTPQAYPYGAVFTRDSVRQRQQEGFARTARELETSLIQVAAGQAVAGTRGSTIDVGSAITAGRELANSLREARAAGRMVVEANPVILAARPELDVLLEPGDVIAMPKRPSEITVVGSVLNPGSLQFRSGWRASDYVRAAGGTQRFADPSRGFIVLPNGQSTAAGLSAWQQGGPPVPPGSLVVVPQDPSPYETWGFVRDLTQVLGQVSVSAAALAVIAREANR
ncbi:SLBB domain-containing protein [Neoroseomonas oryzicola]|uniref:Polysaccharide biosynthesis/export protein n=1 Tax=Neoroseomonas oryzicola TaxID=535904 RepID=A0A9X9WPU1_9PROT|nr:SLBB domain-containing protein [Neoroseomonas oryzicola]MBR0662351.1 polysaccharide biosynthesis/export protein [Neoroseomonas oryzicola]NKE19253.1 polysaccharide biosynthesis/export protein [Neoroseomonas oryzicola]